MTTKSLLAAATIARDDARGAGWGEYLTASFVVLGLLLACLI